MIVVGIVGLKNSGKTRLMQKMINFFSNKKITVGTIKHAHHNFEIDKEGTDSYIHRKSGAREILISSSKRWAKIEERIDMKELNLNELLNKIERSDIVLVEGFKYENHKKIEVFRSTKLNKKPLFQSLNNVVAIVSNEKVKTNLPIFADDDYQNIGKFILSLKNKNE